MKTNKHIFIAGGAGFLGSHLCDRLINEGHTLVCFDNLHTGSLKNITHLMNNHRFTFIKGDVRERFSAEILNQNFDEIWNLACPASPVHYQADPVGTMMTNVLGMKNLLDLAHYNEAKIFQASTSEIYGDPKEHPQKESYLGNVNSFGPRACYDEGKRAAETLCFDYQKLYGLDVRIARIFNTYGPRMDENDGRVVSNFIIQALKNQPLSLYGDGSQTRSFCYVDDLIDGFLNLMRLETSPQTPVNLGNPTEFTVSELGHLVIELTQSSSAFNYLPLPKDDPQVRRPDISRAEQLFGFNPKVNLKWGLLETIHYFAALRRISA